MVFMINNVIGYGLITLFLGIVIKMSKVPFKKMMKGIRGIIFIMLLSVVFSYGNVFGIKIYSYFNGRNRQDN